MTDNKVSKIYLVVSVRNPPTKTPKWELKDGTQALAFVDQSESKEDMTTEHIHYASLNFENAKKEYEKIGLSSERWWKYIIDSTDSIYHDGISNSGEIVLEEIYENRFDKDFEFESRKIPSSFTITDSKHDFYMIYTNRKNQNQVWPFALFFDFKEAEQLFHEMITFQSAGSKFDMKSCFEFFKKTRDFYLSHYGSDEGRIELKKMMEKFHIDNKMNFTFENKHFIQYINKAQAMAWKAVFDDMEDIENIFMFGMSLDKPVSSLFENTIVKHYRMP